MSEEQVFGMEKCECGHHRFTHNRLCNVCFHPKCDCTKFELKKE